MYLTCRNCGTTINEGSAFCQNCGTPVAADLQKTSVGSNPDRRLDNSNHTVFADEQPGYPNQSADGYGDRYNSRGGSQPNDYGRNQGSNQGYSNNNGNGGGNNTKALIIVLIVIIGVLIIAGTAVILLLSGVFNSGKAEEQTTEHAATVAELVTEAATEPETEPETEEELKVPNVVGMKSSDAFAALEAVGLEHETEFEYSSSSPEDYVISQSPAHGKAAEKGMTVLITISRGEKPVEKTNPAPTDPPARSNIYIANDPTDSKNLRASSRYISLSDLDGYTGYEVQLVINELYAKHGYRFKRTSAFYSYFNSQSWYSPNTDSMDVAAARFNKYEEENVKVMAQKRNQLGD